MGFIGLLEKENAYLREFEEKVFKVTGESLTEDYTEYYAELITVVTTLKDPRAVNSLAGCITTGGIATSGLAALGRTALDPVLGLFDSSDENTRQSAAIAMVEMLDQADISGDSSAKEKVKRVLIRSAKDDNHNVRLAAIGGLEKLLRLGDVDVIPLLEDMAQNDPYRLDSSLPGSDTHSYVVREAARKVLQAKK